ncbi:MAG: RnfABCDGE type electron transport complex subunit D [Clostridia bacterium]|nr:RnfABCDGE type electron transport complex subunit D [Clostridia bacterium]
MDNSIVVSTPPHVKSKRTTKSIMLDVVIALLPCVIAGCVYFGWQALLIILMSVFSCVATEFVYFFIANKGFNKKCKDAKSVCVRWVKQFDYTSIVTGIILALILPTTDKWYEVFYEVLIGGIFAIAIVKMLFGGTGKNLVNPAAAARVFMLISFGISTYVACNFGALFAADSAVVTTGATNLAGLLPINGNPVSYLHMVDLLIGTGVAGCIGETCKLAIIVGYVYLAVRKVIKWWQPLLFIAVFGLAAWLMGGFYYDKYTLDIQLFLPNILSGGVLFAAVFMFPDYVTSPKGVYGQLFYLIVAAIVLAVLRYFTNLEVASFVIILMNLFVPLIDKYFIRKPFGYVKVKKEKKVKTTEEGVKEAAENMIVDTTAEAKTDKEGK